LNNGKVRNFTRECKRTGRLVVSQFGLSLFQRFRPSSYVVSSITWGEGP
jgi:hypothetical protein